jgi:hypothetical protein
MCREQLLTYWRHTPIDSITQADGRYYFPHLWNGDVTDAMSRMPGIYVVATSTSRMSPAVPSLVWSLKVTPPGE